MAANLRTWLLPRDSQPQDAIGIDGSNPLAKSLIYLDIPTSRVDVVSGRPLTDVALAVGAGMAGRSFVYNGTSSRRQLSGVVANATDGYTCVALLRSTSASGTQTVLQTDLVSGQIQFLLCIGGQPVFNGMANYNTGWATSGITTDIRGDNKTHLIVGTISGAAARYYIDGKLDASGAVGTITGTKTSLITSGLRPEDSAGFVGDIFLSAVFNRALLPSEVADLAANPWQLLEPRRIIVPVAAAGAGNTIAIPAGGLTLTGFAPTVTATANQVVEVPAGTLTLAAQTLTVTSSDSQTISVPAGTLTLTANAPTVVASENQSISVPAGALTLTGQTPTVTATAYQVVEVPAGALTLTGYAPTVSVSDASAVQVPAGTLTLTGFAPTVAVSANNAISVPLGTLTLTGQAPTVVATDPQLISVPAGALTLTGYAPTVSNVGVNNQILVPRGTLTLTGGTPTVRVSTDADVFLDRFAARSRITQSLRFGSRITTQVGLCSPLKD